MAVALEEHIDMAKAAAVLTVAAVMGFGVLSQPTAAKAQLYNSHRAEWTVAPGYFGFSSYPWPGPPFGSPAPKPTYGCYFTRARLQNAWRQVEVCS